MQIIELIIYVVLANAICPIPLSMKIGNAVLNGGIIFALIVEHNLVYGTVSYIKNILYRCLKMVDIQSIISFRHVSIAIQVRGVKMLKIGYSINSATAAQ